LACLCRRHCVASGFLRAKRQTSFGIDVSDVIVVESEQRDVDDAGRLQMRAQVDGVATVKHSPRHYFKLCMSGTRKTRIRDVVGEFFTNAVWRLRNYMRTVLSGDRRGERED